MFHDQRVVQCGNGIGPSTGRNNCQVFSFNGFNMVSYSFVTEIFGICWNWWHQDHQVTSSEDITRSWNSLRPFGHTDEHNHPAQMYREPSKRGRFGTRIDTKLLKGGNVAMSCDVQNSRGCSGECYDVLCLRMGQISMSGVKVYSWRVGHILPIALTDPHVESCHCEARNLVQESFNEFLTQWIKYIVFWCRETLWPYGPMCSVFFFDSSTETYKHLNCHCAYYATSQAVNLSIPRWLVTHFWVRDVAVLSQLCSNERRCHRRACPESVPCGWKKKTLANDVDRIRSIFVSKIFQNLPKQVTPSVWA